MNIVNILNEAVYADKSITATKIMREIEEKRNRKFGISLDKYFVKKGVIMDFNNEAYSLEKKPNLIIYHMPKNLTKEYLSKILSGHINSIWNDYLDKRDNFELDISKHFGGKNVHIKISTDNSGKNYAEATVGANRSGGLITLFINKVYDDEANIKNILKHEITHIQDYIRGKFKQTHSKKEFDNEDENYYGGVYEFNRFINLISNRKTRSKRIRERLANIKTPEDLKNFLRDEAEEEAAAAFINNKELFKRLIKRLHREKLINFSNIGDIK